MGQTKSVKELIALAKAKPGMNYASSGSGSAPHLAGELFKYVRSEVTKWGKVVRAANLKVE